MGHAEFDLSAYLTRIGLSHPVAPDLPGLRAVVAHHTATIPFESIDPFLGQPVRIDLPSLTGKLIRDRRGGYCFEQNLLLLAALRAMGFSAAPRLARVVRGQAEDAMTPRSHVMLRVDLPEGRFLVDVGFGNLTPTGPLDLASDAPQPTPHEWFQLSPMGAELVSRARIGEEWQGLYRLGPETPPAIDLEMANWFTATHPASPFTGNLIVARPAPGERRTLFNLRFVRRAATGTEVRYLSGAAELGEVLADAFDLILPSEVVDRLALAAGGRTADQRFSGFFS